MDDTEGFGECVVFLVSGTDGMIFLFADDLFCEDLCESVVTILFL